MPKGGAVTGVIAFLATVAMTALVLSYSPGFVMFLKKTFMPIGLVALCIFALVCSSVITKANAKKYKAAFVTLIVYTILLSIVIAAVHATYYLQGASMPGTTSHDLECGPYTPPPGRPVRNATVLGNDEYLFHLELEADCYQSDLVLKPGQIVTILQVEPVGVWLPSVYDRTNKPISWKVAKYGGYRELGEHGDPMYLMAEELRWSKGIRNPCAFFGAPMIGINNATRLASEGGKFVADSLQSLYFTSNLFDGLGGRGFYRIRFRIDYP
jgi:hypothetical protein